MPESWSFLEMTFRVNKAHWLENREPQIPQPSRQAASLLGGSELNSVVGSLGARAETWAWRCRMLQWE